MGDGEELHRTTMLLTAEQQATLDAIAHSRTEAVRRLLTERSDVGYPAESDPDPGRCPECGRETVLELVSADAIAAVAADGDVVDYCVSDSAVHRVYVHQAP